MTTMEKVKRFEIHDYSSAWPRQFESVASYLHQKLGANIISIYHIGSTSVPGLCAKEDIDVLCVVKRLSETQKLEKSGFKFKGELNVPLRYFFSSNTPELPKVNLHVCEQGHGFVALNLAFRDALRSDKKLRDSYGALKKKLVENPESFRRTPQGFVRYTLDKDSFIKRVLKDIGFDGCAVNYCTHYHEWDTYHKLKKKHLFQGQGIAYDTNHPSIQSPHHKHLVLYKGVDIVAAAQVEEWQGNDLILRAFVVDEGFRRQGLGKYFLEFIEAWGKHFNKQRMLLHSGTDVISFYRNQGFSEFNFEDVSAFEATVKMGKSLVPSKI